MIAPRQLLRRFADPLIAAGLTVGYVTLLLLTVDHLGYARDEGFYYQAAQSYAGWFDLLLSDPTTALTRQSIDRHWSINHEHPALMKSLFALSLRYLHAKWQWFDEAGTALRFPGMVVSSLALGVTYRWGSQTLGRVPGLVAALWLGLMPRVFHHAHLACFDMPVTALWLVTAYAYWRASVRGGLLWPIATGVLYGLLLNTKHNSWLLPFALLVHLLVTQRGSLGRELRAGRLPVPTALVAMLTIGPLVLYATWPWLWHDTAQRLSEYVAFHTGHEYYNMEFLGQTYWKPPMPLGYAWVMTAATVPAVILLSFVVGLGSSGRALLADAFGPEPAARFGALARALGQRLRILRAETPVESYARPAAAATDSHDGARPAGQASTEWLWLLCLLVCYAPWLSSKTPIFGGTKHWLTAYPFLCLFAGRGFLVVRERLAALLRSRLPQRVERWPVVSLALAVSVLAGPVVMTFDAHPWGLSAYTPLVGGAPGAASLGLNRTFWGYTTGAVQQVVNQEVPAGGTLYLHDTALQSFELMRRDGRLRHDIRGTLHIQESDLALYHHEPHMSRVEHQIWVDYGTRAPVHVGTHHGVPVVWVYARPVAGGERAGPQAP